MVLSSCQPFNCECFEDAVPLKNFFYNDYLKKLHLRTTQSLSPEAEFLAETLGF